MRWLWGLLLLFVCISVDNKRVSYAVTDPMCIAATLDSEDRTGTLQSRRAVYDVLRERMARAGLNACDIVLQKHQFSGMSLKKIAQTDKESLTRMWEVATLEPSCQGCTHFTRIDVHKDWMKKFRYRGRIGFHKFYQEELK